MAQGEEDIRREIEGTRAAMAEKIGLVEERMHETAEEVKSTIDSTIGGFKHMQATAEETKSVIGKLIETAKESANDVANGVRQNPWLMLGSAGLLGYVVGSLSGEQSRWRDRSKREAHRTDASAVGYPEAVIQCSKCGQMIRQADMVRHSAQCTGHGLPSHGGIS